MTATNELGAFHSLPESSQLSHIALSILIERIGTLPKDDRDDLFELIQGWRDAETDEERHSCRRAMDEILAKNPMTATPMPIGPAKPGDDADPWCQHVGKTIRELREAASLTQIQLAQRSGLTQSHISRIENAGHRPTHFTLQKIAKALDVTVGQIDPCSDD